MTERIVTPPASLLSSTATGLPVLKAENNASTGTTISVWTIAFMGRKEVPVMQFRHVEPMKVLSNLLIELGWLTNGHLVGRLLLPNGLRPADGVRLRIDEMPLGGKLSFESVNRHGSVVSLNWDAASVLALREGQMLGIHAIVASSRKPISYKIPLAGFGFIAERLKELINQRNS
ncbi:invasion associated locus B family protein [Rhizobium terrae]|uniref:invasion associated locus B family protein n=1 Tax=Rhizobium terrae TaxID=2171756 RepID=UPI0013C32259|nr:invasion associated locus B family protein [Rhizobium terrae]